MRSKNRRYKQFVVCSSAQHAVYVERQWFSGMSWWCSLAESGGPVYIFSGPLAAEHLLL